MRDWKEQNLAILKELYAVVLRAIGMARAPLHSACTLLLVTLISEKISDAKMLDCNFDVAKNGACKIGPRTFFSALMPVLESSVAVKNASPKA
jgi:hypothetical protein